MSKEMINNLQVALLLIRDAKEQAVSYKLKYSKETDILKADRRWVDAQEIIDDMDSLGAKIGKLIDLQRLNETWPNMKSIEEEKPPYDKHLFVRYEIKDGTLLPAVVMLHSISDHQFGGAPKKDKFILWPTMNQEIKNVKEWSEA